MASSFFPVSPPRTQIGTELLQKKVPAKLLLLLGLSAVFLASIWYNSHSFMFMAKEALIKSALQADHLLVNLRSQITYDESQTGSSSVGASPEIPDRNSTFTIAAGASPEIPDKNSTFTIESCDMSVGKWVRDTREPTYSNLTCRFLPEAKNCQKYGKPPGYLYWRWKPDGCDLPRFEPERFLNLVRGKTLAFVGDSLARNQFDSLLCLLSQVEYPIDEELNPFKKFHKIYYPSSNFTLMVLWTEFYVHGVPSNNGATTASFDLHLDKINTKWTSELPGLDYLVINGGNWFVRKHYLYENNKLIGCLFCKGENLTEYSMSYVVRRVLRKALESIESCQDCDGLVTLARSFTTSHFEDGLWFNGGICNRTELLNESEINYSGHELVVRNIQKEEIERIRGFDGFGKGEKYYGLMDITKAMMIRADGHPGSYYNKDFYKHTNDCLHWCLPGPVDMWNEMLMHNLMKSSSLY